MRVSYEKEIVSGKASSTDVVEASAKAYLNCLNRFLFFKDKTRRGTTRPRTVAGKKTPARRKTRKG